MKQKLKEYQIPLLLYICFFAVWVVMTRGAVSPLIYPDEAGYIGWARKLAGLEGLSWRYLPGYGALLSPIFWFTENVLQAYPVMILFNCLMGAALPVLFYDLLGRFLEGKKRLLATVVAGLYPAWLVYGNFALSEIFLVFLYTLLLWSVTRWSKGKRYFVLSLACCLWLVASHGRGGAAVLGTLAAGCAYVWNKPWRKTGVRIVGVLLLLATGFAVWYLWQTDSVNGAHLREQVLGLLSVKGVWNTLSTLLSQSYYLLLSTFGVVALGVWQTLKELKQQKQNPALWFVLVTFVFTLLLSALFMNHHEKPDHILYGRYNEFALGGILLLGLVGVFKQKRFWWVGGLFLLLALFTRFRFGDVVADIDSNLCHTWGLYFYKLLFSRFTHFGVAVWFGLWGVIFYWLCHKNPSKGLLLLGFLFLVSAGYTKYDYFIKGAVPRYQPSQLATFVGDSVSAKELEGNTMGYPWGVYHLLTLRPDLILSEEAPLILTQDPQGEIVASETYDTLYLCRKEGVNQGLFGEVKITDWNENGLTLFAKNTGGPWLCYAGAEKLTDCVRVVVQAKSQTDTTEFRMDFPYNLYENDRVSLSVPLGLEDGEYHVQLSVAVDLSYAIASAAVGVTVKEGKIIRCQPAETKETEFLVLEAEAYPRQTKGLFRGYSTGHTVYGSLGWRTDKELLVIGTRDTKKEASVQVNGTTLPLERTTENTYEFSLQGISRIDRLEIDCKTVAPAKQGGLPAIFRFLRADSPCKPVSLFVRGMDKLFGLPLDFYPYGIWVEEIRLEDGVSMKGGESSAFSDSQTAVE